MSWIQGAQPVVRPVQRSAYPPPTCFNCGVTGHFVVDCPESQQRQVPAGFQALPTTSHEHYQAPQQTWPSQPVAPQNQYAPSYSPAQQPQYNSQPPAQHQQPYVPPPQPYVAQTSNQQYGRPPYQAPVPQFPGPPSQGYPVQQSYGPQAVPPYQPPPTNNYPPTPMYGGAAQSPQHSFPTHNSAPQWNAPQPVPQQSFQPPSRSNSVAQNPYFRTPSQQPQTWQPNHSLSRQQSFDHGSKGFFHQQNRTSVTPVPNPSAVPQYHMQAQHQSPVKPELTGNSVSNASVKSAESTIVVEVPNDRPDTDSKLLVEQAKEDEESEEGEYGPEDEAEEIFQWDYEHAFEEVVPKETVALAQPLSASFNTTPVPLIQAWSTKIPSISRYARKDNVTEFVRTIRSSPQWTYLQEDPAFTESDHDGILIPFDDVPAWAAARHQLMSMEAAYPGDESSRKRSRDEDGRDYVEGEGNYEENEIGYVAAVVDTDAPANKRQKQNVSGAGDDEVMEDVRGTTPGSMIVIQNARGGTPCLVNNSHDTWAPEPGERATSPPDPTEQLLASLGVSGEAKPVQQQELPPYTGTGDDVSSRNASQTPASSQFAQVNPAQQHGLPMNQNFPNANGTPFSHNRSMSNTPMNAMNRNQNHAPYNSGNGQNMNGQINGPPINNNFTNNQSQGPFNGYTAPVNGPPMYASQANAPHMNPPQMNAPHTQGPPMAALPMTETYVGGQPAGGFPNKHTQVKGTPVNAPNMNSVYVAPVVAQNQYGPPVNTGYSPPVQPPNYQTAPPQTNTYRPNPHYGQPVNNTLVGGNLAQAPYVQPGYGAPANTQYANGPPNNYAQGNPQGPHGPPQYAQTQGPAPVHGQQGYNQFGPPQTYAPGPQPAAPFSQPQYGPPTNQPYVNGPVNQQQAAPQYGPPQQVQPYANAQQPPNQYGAPTQMSPAQYGPPQVLQYQQAQPYSNGRTPQYANGAPVNFQSSTGPPAQIPVNNLPQNGMSQRQDSGYYSAGGFQKSCSGANEYNGQNGPPQDVQQMQQTPNGFNGQNGQPMHAQQGQHQFNNENIQPQQAGFQQGPNDNAQNGMGPSPPMKYESVQPSDQPALQDITNTKSENVPLARADSKKGLKQQDSDATLTDLEKELLGELEPTPTRRNPQRKAAAKKPQPVVEAAYGRRW